MEYVTDYTLSFWDLLPVPLVRGAMLLVGLTLLVHFALMAKFVPWKKTRWYVLDSMGCVAATGMWVLCAAIAGTVQDIQLAASVAACAMLLFVLALWRFGLKISLFAKHRHATVMLWAALEKEEAARNAALMASREVRQSEHRKVGAP